MKKYYVAQNSEYPQGRKYLVRQRVGDGSIKVCGFARFRDAQNHANDLNYMDVMKEAAAQEYRVIEIYKAPYKVQGYAVVRNDGAECSGYACMYGRRATAQRACNTMNKNAATFAAHKNK